MKYLKKILANWKYVAFAILLFIGYDIIFRKESPVVIPGQKAGEPVTFKEGEKEIIGVVGRKITVVKKKEDGSIETETTYIPADGGVRITVKDDGSTEVYVKNKGWAMSPGLGVIYADSVRVSLDLNIAYWNRMGVNVGVGIGRSPVAAPFVAVNYSWGNVRFQNTALMVGWTTRRDWLVGVRVRF